MERVGLPIGVLGSVVLDNIREIDLNHFRYLVVYIVYGVIVPYAVTAYYDGDTFVRFT